MSTFLTSMNVFAHRATSGLTVKVGFHFKNTSVNLFWRVVATSFIVHQTEVLVLSAADCGFNSWS